MTPLLLDITRLLARSRSATPTGIDRFELHYARWCAAQPDRRPVFIESTRNGPAVVRPERVAQLSAEVSARWLGNDATGGDLLDRVVATIDGEAATLPATRIRSKVAVAGVSRMDMLVGRAAGSLRAMALRAALSPSAAFVHVSHARLDRPGAFEWLGARPRGLFYVHDLIPLSHPEYVTAGEPDRHARRLETVQRHARHVVCNSQATAAALAAYARTRGLAMPPATVLEPGIEDAFLDFQAANAVVAQRPYFVCVGTIEPRKNHALLLNIWRRLVERDGDAAPRLVLIGRRGWDNVELFKRLDLLAARPGAVIEVAALSDRATARLVGGAAALLAPSYIEGYGMQVAEARALGTPILVSDLASHREIAGDGATLLDPLNGPGWLAAIDAHATMRHRIPLASRSRRTWQAHFSGLEDVLRRSFDDVALPPHGIGHKAGVARGGRRALFGTTRAAAAYHLDPTPEASSAALHEWSP